MLKKLRDKRAKLLREAEALQGRNGTFANDQARADFDGKMAEIEAIDEQIREFDAGSDDTRSESIAEHPVGEGTRQETRTQDDAERREPTDHDRGAAVERERVQGIMVACKAARVTRGFEEKLISSGVPLVEAQRKVFDELQKRGVDDAGPRRGPQVRMTGEDPLVHVRKGIENALLHRVSPSMFKLEEYGQEYRGMTLIDVARSYLNANGVRTTSMSKMEIAGTALGLNQRGGYHTTSDFSDLLGDVISRTLLRAYEEAPQTFKPIARQISASDFKDIALLNMGEAPSLEEVVEHGEFTRGSITTSAEQFRLKTYGRIFAVTRQVLVNDDVDAFSRVPTMFGRAARTLESDKVWAQITSNPTMSDGNALFSAAHANLETDGDVISIASLSRARTAIRLQTGLDGSRLNLTPKILLVPPSLETVAQQFVAIVAPQLVAAVPGNANPFSGLLQVIAEPRLEDDSTTAWYVIASPDQLDVLVYAFLEGETGPTIERRVGFDIDGLEIKARHDFAAKVVDWRGIHKDPGEDVS